MINASLRSSEPQYDKNENFFSEENRKVWELSFRRREEFLKEYSDLILQEYIDGFYALKFDPIQIPSLEQLNSSLNRTGWQVIYVDGYLHQNYYAELLSQKIAPVSRYVRSLSHLHYAPGPDMLHDIFGHLPMLFSPDYSDYIVSLGKVMREAPANIYENQLYQLHIELANSHETLGNDHVQTKEVEKKIEEIEHNLDLSPPPYTLLERFFMWTIEFGILLNNNGKLQMYGAGLLSSEHEAKDFCKGQSSVVPFTYAATKIGYNFSSFQKQYFFANSFKDLRSELEKFKQLIIV
jgi:phenylalanine-4-hydroxylase